MSSNSPQPPNYSAPPASVAPPPPSQTPTYWPGQRSPQQQYSDALRNMTSAANSVNSRHNLQFGDLAKRGFQAMYDPWGAVKGLSRSLGFGSNPNIRGNVDLNSGTVTVKRQGKDTEALNKMFTDYLRGVGPKPTGGDGAFSALNKKIAKAHAGGYTWTDPNAPPANAPTTMGGPGFSPNAPGRLMWNRVPAWYSKKYGG